MTFDQLTWHDGASSACGRPGGVSESINEKDAVRAREVGHELVDEVPSGDGACCERSVLRWKVSLDGVPTADDDDVLRLGHYEPVTI